MTGSWLCLPLLLVGALLLGQLAWGAEEEEQPSFGNSQELQVPEEPEEQMAPASYEEQEEELQLLASEEGGRRDCCRGAILKLSSDELAEQRASAERHSLKDESQSYFLKGYFKRLITKYFNEQSPKHFYKLYEDADLKIKDAPGFTVEFTVYMVKTNCTRDEEDLLGVMPHRFRHFDYEDEESTEDLSNCHPLSGEDEEIQKCKFSMYVGGRHSQHTIVDHRCKPVEIVDERED